MDKIYELRRLSFYNELKNLAYSPSKELIFQLAIDMYNLTRINEYYLNRPESNVFIHLDFLKKGLFHSIDMIGYIKNQKQRVGKIGG